jgi:C-8 sterol isomerase
MAGSSVLLLLAVVVAALSAGSYYLAHKTDYTFDPAVMQHIAQAAINATAGQPQELPRLMELVVGQLRQRYGRHIVAQPEWIFNNAGGAMGAMLVLHCSISEYIIIFGTPLGTEGHTGRFLADDYFTILHGEQWAFAPGDLAMQVYKPGDQHHLPFGAAKQYKMHRGCWALEYARGNIPSMLPFGLVDTLSSTLDFYSLWRTVRISAIGMIGELLNGKI